VADIYGDGQVRVYWAPSISNIAAPTVAELNAGINLGDTMTPDGLSGFEATTADVPTDALTSTYDTVTIGRDSFSGPSLKFKKQTPGADTIRSTLTRGATGFVAVRRGYAATLAWATGQQLEVFPAICGRRKETPPAKNTLLFHEVPIKIWQSPNQDAVVA
jgi:hypothetical protein